MAQHYEQSFVNSPEQVTVKFRFQVNGTSDPDFIVPHKCGVTDVTYAATGLFSITFAEKYPTLIGVVGAVLENNSGAPAAHDLIVKASVASYSATTGILTVMTVGADGLTAAEAPVDNDWVYIEATFCKNSVLAPSGSI